MASFREWTDQYLANLEEEKKKQNQNQGQRTESFTDFTDRYLNPSTNINTWIQQPRSISSDISKFYNTWRSKADSEKYNSTNYKRIQELLSQADSWRKQYAGNDDAIAAIDQTVNDLIRMVDYASRSSKYYSQWDTEDAYTKWSDYSTTSGRQKRYEDNQAEIDRLTEQLNGSAPWQRNEIKSKIKALQQEMQMYERGNTDASGFYYGSKAVDDYTQLESREDFQQASSNRNFQNPTRDELRELDILTNPNTWRFNDDGSIYDAMGNQIDPNNTDERGNILHPLAGAGVTDRLGLFLNATDEEKQEAYGSYMMYGDEGSWEAAIKDGADGSWDQLKENEISIYYYLMNTSGRDAADQYLADMKPELNRREAEQSSATLRQQFEESNALERLALSIASIGTQQFGGLAGFIEDTANTILGNDINPYSHAHTGQIWGNEVRALEAQRWDDATGNVAIPFINFSAGDLYQAGMSSLDMLFGAALDGTGFSQALQNVTEPFELALLAKINNTLPNLKLIEKMGLLDENGVLIKRIGVGAYELLMGTGSATAEARKLYEQGANNYQIAVGASLVGAAEIISEHASIEKLFYDMDPQTKLDWVKSLLIQGGFEASEEGFTEIANTLTNIAVMGDQSDWAQLVKENGGDYGKAFLQKVSDTLNAAMGGFVSGVASSGATGAVGLAANEIDQNIHYNEQGRNIVASGNLGGLIQSANELRDTKGSAKLKELANQLAGVDEKFVGPATRSESRSLEKKAGQLYKGVLSEQAQQADDSRRTVFDRMVKQQLEESGFGNVDQATRVISKAMYGGSLTKPESRLFDSVNGRKVIENVLNAKDADNNSRFETETQKEATRKTSAFVDTYMMANGGTSENTSAGEYSVSGENDTILTNKDGTSESVKISNVASVKGGLMLELSDGRTVSAKDISYATSGEAALYAAIADMNITAEAANSLIAGAASSGLSMESYALGVKEAYRFGKLGIPYDQISGNGFAVDLNDAQRKTAYYLGSNAGASEASEKSSAAASTAKRNKEGKIVYENVNLNGRKLNDQQRAGIQLAKFLARSGISVHVYESVKGKDGKYRNRFGGANGVYSNGTIYIDLAAGNSGQGTMAYTISHELTHLIEKTSPVEFRTFANALFDELGKSKVDVDQMIATKLEQVKNQAQNRNKSESELYDIAYSEVVAECCETMLTDTDAATRVASKICQQNKSLGQKILNFLKNLVQKLQQAYKDMNLAPDSQIANQARQTIQNVESLRDLWSDALAATIQRVNGKNVQTTQSVAGGDVDIDGQENVHMLSDRTMAEGAGFVFHELTGDGKPYEILDKNGNVVTHATVDQVKSSPLGSLVGTAVTNGFITDKEAEKQYEYLTKLVNMAIKYEGLAPVWEISGSMVFSSIKDNSDPQYGLTIDFSTICKKTQAIVDAMSKTMMELGRGLTRSEVEKVYLETGKAGESTPCPVCYVFSRWFGIGGLLDQIKRYQETYYEMSDADIQKFIADCDAEIFDYAAEKNKPNYYDKSGWLNTGKVISDVKGKYDAIAAKALKSLANNANLQIQIQEMEELLKMQSGKEAQKTQRRIQKLRSKIVDAAAAEAAYNEANANKERFEAYQWMTSTMLMDQDGTYVRNPDFKPVPNSVLFDLNKGGEFAENYPLSWAFRTGKGSAMGKAITPYADARVGEAIQGVAKGKVKDIQIGMDLNPFLNGDNKTRDKIINSAIAKIRRQNLIGGMRYQSTSDFRYEFGSDYLITFMEMQAIGAKVQLYTKVIEAVDFLASMGADCNLSVMPLGDGYVTQADGTKKLVFSSVTGINADAAIQKAHQYNNVQLILVGINDENIRLALAGEDVTFVIPFHGSGQNVHQIQTLMNLLGENLDVVKAQDYEKVQTDHVDPNRTEAQQAAWDLRTRIIKGKATEITADELAILESNKYLKDLYRRFYLDEDAEEYGLSLTGDAAKQIFPYEYWDRSLTYAEADQNGERFQEYCASMGIIPRFSGKDSAGRDMGFGNFTKEKGYWKLLIDRKMYENTYDENGNWTGYGKFHEQAKINCSKFEVSQLDREYGSKTYGDVMSKENDPSKTDAIVRNAIASFQNKSSVMISDKLAAAKGELHSDRDSLTTDKQRANYDYNLNNNTPGSPLRTMAYTKKTGGNIERMGGVVGKNLKSNTTPIVYFHRQYLQDAMKVANMSAADYSKAFDVLKKAHPDLAEKFNHVTYNAENESITFGYSKYFDVDREPAAGETFQVYYNSDEKPRYREDCKQIFHHKWAWVEDDYTGFDIAASWEWSKQWLNAIRPTKEVGGGFAPRGIADGTHIEAWNRQLDHFGLPHDTVAEQRINDGKSLYSLRTVEPVQPTSGWSRGSTYADIRSEYPGFRNSDAKNEYVEDMNPDYEARKAERIKLAQRTAAGKRGNGTQRPNTVVTYDRLYDKLEREGFKGTILDASSGLGLGTDHGIKRGFDVEDIEPYFGDGYYPIYSDYSRLNKQYDVVISSAVINVLTQDDSDAMVKAIGNALKPGGRAFITVRGASDVDSALKGGKSVRLSDTAHEWYVPGSDNYQRGWGADEFLAYVRDALGDGYKVEKNPKYWDVKKGKEEKWGDTSVLVTKSADYELHSDRIVEQKHTSAGTSMNVDKIPVLYTKAGKKGFFKSGTVNIDIGAGKYDTATEYLDGLGVTNMPFDPFNRTRSVNKEVVDFLVAGGKADTATCSNCLNVIDNADARANVVLEMAKAIKPDGVALFTVYSDEKSLQAGKAGQNARKPDQWQEFRALSTYSEEVKRYFDDVTIRDGTIIARSPKANLPKAAWQIASQYSAVENGASDEAVMYSERRNIGYHAGDLGKSEYLRNQNSGRGTGHFGTGTYFVGNKETVTDNPYYGKRPQHAVDFSNYNLFRVRNDETGYALHDALKFIDGSLSEAYRLGWFDNAGNSLKPTEYFYDADDHISKIAEDRVGYDFDALEESPDETWELFYKAHEPDNVLEAAKEFADKYGYDILSREDFSEQFGYSVDDEDFMDEYIRAVKESLNKQHEELSSRYDDFKRAYDNLERVFRDEGKIKRALISTAIYEDEIENRYDHTRKDDSFATAFMKAMGYDGVDVRGTGLDNTTYGSVIYDLKNDDVLYAERTKNSDLAGRDDVAVTIKNTKMANYIHLIFDKDSRGNYFKTEETRSQKTLEEYVGKQVMISDGKRVYGVVEFGKPRFIEAKDFHSKENQLKHRVPRGDDYDVKGKGKWAYPITVIEKYKTPKKLSDSNEYQYSFQARTVMYSSREETTRIKEQISAITDKLNEMDVVVSVTTSGFKGYRNSDVAKYVSDEFSKFGSRVERKDFGVVLLEYAQINKALNYLNTEAEKVALLTVPRVIKRGILAESHVDHKDRREVDSYTFAAPVEINGVRGNVGVVVQRVTGTNRFKTLRILLPNGKAFEFAQKNEADSTTGSKLAQSARGTPIESASDLKLSQNGIDVNKSDFRKSDRDDGGMSNRRLLVNALDTAVQSDLEERKLDQYREKIEQVSEEQIKLGELNKQIHELSFGKGKRDTAKLQALRDEATKTANRINLIDKQLLTLESTKVLKNVLEREREKARKAAEQKGREAVAAARKAAAQRQQEIVDKYREKRQEAIDKRISTQYRNKIKKYMEDFRKRLMSPTDRKYIPAALVEGIVDLYDAIDPTGKDPNSKAAQKYQSVKEALADIKMQYDGLKDSDSYDFKSEFSEEFSSVIAELANSIGNTPLRKMSRAQLEDVYSIIHDIAAMVTYATKQIGTKEAITNYEAGTQIIEAMDKARSAGISRDAINSFFREWTLNPMRAVREMSMFDQDARLVKLFTDLNDGRKKADKFSMDSHKKFDALRSDKAGEKAFNDAVETAGIKVTDADGNEQHISKMQAMQAILTFEREMANDKRNHLRSPVRFTNVALDVKGRYSDAFDRGYDVYVNVDFVDQVMKQLSDWDKNYMAMARRFFNVDSKNAVNETTMITKHRPVAMENAYIPYYVNQDYIAKESENVKFDASIEGMGMLKSVKNNAPQQIVIRGLNQVISDHIGKVSKVYGLAVPVRNWNKAFNVRQTDEDGGRSVKSAIRDAWHDGGLKLLDQAVADVQSNRRAESVAALSTVKSAFVTSTLASNLSVWMKQAASYPTAGAYLSTVSLAKALPKFGMNLKKTWNEIDEHTSQHYIRRLGMSTQELGEVNQTHGWQNRLNKKLGALSPMNWIQAMDVKTTAVIWEACKYEVQSKGTKAGSENYWDEVTKLYDKVIEETQPMYDSLHRAEITKNAALRNIIMFQTQPIQNSGILREGAMEYKMAKKQYGAKSQQANAAAKKYAMAVGSQLASHFVFTAMTLLSAALMHKMNPWRDDDTNEVTAKSVSMEFLRQFGTNVFGAIFPVFGSYAISIAEKISGASKYDVLSDPTVDKINTTIDNFTKLFVEDKDGNTVPSLDGFLTMACDISSYFSIPAGNIRNIVNGARLHIEDAANGEFLSFDAGAKPSNSQKRDSLYEAIMSGDKAAIANAKARYETQKEIDAAMRSALRENDPRIQEAAKAQIAGNNDRRVSIARQIIAEGHFSQNIVVAAINNEISALSKKEDEEYNARDVSLYTTDDYVQAILNGKDTTQIVKEIVRSKLVNGSKDEEAAYKALLSSAKSQLKETFLDGKLTSSDVVDALMAMDMTESAAKKRVQYWDFADKHEDVDWSENNVDNYITTVEPAGISVDVFDSYLTKASKCKGTDANNDGKTDSGSVKTEVLAVINALPISSYQKDVLYRLNGWSERELRKAPWH